MDLNLPSSVQAEEEKDIVASGGVLDAAVYKGTVELVYMDKAASGAININIHFNNGSRVIRQTIYISNKKGGFTYHKDGKDFPLPGYSQVDHFFKAVTSKGIAQQVTEEKTIKIYDYDAKKELPQQRTVFMEALGKPMAVGVIKVSEEKTTKDSGYVDGTGEFREYNEFDKWFNAETGMTRLEELDDSITEATFIHKWKEKNEGKVKVKRAKNPGAAASGATSGAPTPSESKPTTSLFS